MKSIKINGFRRIKKEHAFRRFCNGKTLYLCPSKLRPGGPWSHQYVVTEDTIAEYKEKSLRYQNNPELWKGTVDLTAWQLLYNNYAYYNLSEDTGTSVHYYIKDE